MRFLGSQIAHNTLDPIGFRVRALIPKPGFLVINLCLIVAVCAVFIWFRWDDLSNWDLRIYAYGGIDFASYPKRYGRTFVEKPPLAFLMYLPMAFLPAVAGQAIFFAIVIASEALLLRWLLRALRFDEAACLGATAFFLATTLFKHQLDYVSLSHLTNLLILGACIAAIKGSIRGSIVSGLLIAASFYVRQNNVIFAFYPLILGRFTELRMLVVYAISMLFGFLVLFGLFCAAYQMRAYLSM